MSSPVPALPGRVVFRSPTTPRLQMGPPVSLVLTVVPVLGPPGPPGAEGPPGGIGTGEAQTLIDDSVTAHVLTPEPHPAYDDLPSLLLLFENGLV